MLTAVFAGMLVLGAAVWLAGLLVLIDVPKSGWTVALSGMGGDLPVGTSVTLTDGAQPPVEIARGIVQEAGPKTGNAGTVTIHQVQELSGSVPEARALVWGTAGSTLAANVSAAEGIPVFKIWYLQLGVGIGILVAGAAVIYWLVGRRPGSVDFLVAVDGEMKKVNWSTRRIVQNSTTVVILASFLLAGALFIIDWGFGFFFQTIGVMPRPG